MKVKEVEDLLCYEFYKVFLQILYKTKTSGEALKRAHQDGYHYSTKMDKPVIKCFSKILGSVPRKETFIRCDTSMYNAAEFSNFNGLLYQVRNQCFSKCFRPFVSYTMDPYVAVLKYGAPVKTPDGYVEKDLFYYTTYANSIRLRVRNNLMVPGRFVEIDVPIITILTRLTEEFIRSTVSKEYGLSMNDYDIEVLTYKQGGCIFGITLDITNNLSYKKMSRAFEQKCILNYTRRAMGGKPYSLLRSRNFNDKEVISSVDKNCVSYIDGKYITDIRKILFDGMHMGGPVEGIIEDITCVLNDAGATESLMNSFRINSFANMSNIYDCFMHRRFGKRIIDIYQANYITELRKANQIIR